MANKQNLIPGGHKLTLEEQSMGGVASGIARREKKRGRELMRMLLQCDLTDKAVIDALKKAGHITDDMDNETAMNLRQIEKALKTGDTKAYKVVMEMAGYLEKTVNVKTPAPLVITEEEAAKLDKWAKDE